MDLISIIVPIYNAEKYIDDCIKSILNQTYSRFELILIDDGSSDRSLEICNNWKRKDERIHVYSQKNGGASAARNFGLKVMQGDYVVFVDSDDWVSPKYIEFLYKSIKLDDYDIVQCNLKATFDRDEKIDVDHNFEINKIREITKIQALNYRVYKVSVWAKIYKKDIFDNFRFREGAIYEDDASYYIFIYRAKKIAILEETLYYYYMSDNSVMRNDKSLDLAFIDIYKERIEFFIEKDEKEFLEGSIARFCLVLLLSYGSVVQDIELRENIFDLYVQNYNEIKNSKYLLARDKKLFFFFRILPKLCSVCIKFARGLRKRCQLR